MSRRPSESAGMLEFALEMGKRLSQVLSDGLPEEAKHHLLNAQRELITALVIMYEHQAGARRSNFVASRPAAPVRRAKVAERKPRSTRIPIE